MLLARQGMRVLLIDRTIPGHNKVCGGFLGPEATELWDKIQMRHPLTKVAEQTINRIETNYGSHDSIRISLGDKGGYSVDRSLFDAYLAGEARASGCETRWNSTILSKKRVSQRWECVLTGAPQKRIACRFFVNATGRRIKANQQNKEAFFGCKTTYHIADYPSHQVSLLFVPQGHIGFNPLSDKRVLMCLAVHPRYLKQFRGNLDYMMNYFGKMNPRIMRILKNARRTTTWTACPAESDYQIIPFHEGVWNIGDAIAMINPILGCGITSAIKSAIILSKELIENQTQGRSVDNYKWNARREWSPILRASQLLGAVEKAPWASYISSLLLKQRPQLARRLFMNNRPRI